MSDDVKVKERLRAEIAGFMTRVPASVNAGSYNTAIDFKTAVSKARGAVNARNSTVLSLQEALSSLRRFK
jgi:hypothetical protein